MRHRVEFASNSALLYYFPIYISIFFGSSCGSSLQCIRAHIFIFVDLYVHVSSLLQRGVFNQGAFASSFPLTYLYIYPERISRLVPTFRFVVITEFPFFSKSQCTFQPRMRLQSIKPNYCVLKILLRCCTSVPTPFRYPPLRTQRLNQTMGKFAFKSGLLYYFLIHMCRHQLGAFASSFLSFLSSISCRLSD
jgi:hypothetical protein